MMERTYLTNVVIFAASYNYFHNISFSPSLLYSDLIFTSKVLILCKKGLLDTAQKMKFTIKDFFSKCDQIRKKLRIWSRLLKKSLKENFIFCAVSYSKLCNLCYSSYCHYKYSEDCIAITYMYSFLDIVNTNFQ